MSIDPEVRLPDCGRLRPQVRRDKSTTEDERVMCFPRKRRSCTGTTRVRRITIKRGRLHNKKKTAY